jgi:transketolase
VSIEASVTSTLAKYVGLDGVSIGIDRFGMSAPGGEVMVKLGMTADNVVAAARKLQS